MIYPIKRDNRAFRDDLVDGPVIRNMNWTTLISLPGQMRNWYCTFRQLDCLADLNWSWTLATIVGHLTQPLQFPWSEFVSSIIRLGRKVTFMDLTEFVFKRADVLMVQQPYSPRSVPTKSHVQAVPGSPLKITTYHTQRPAAPVLPQQLA